MRSGVLVERARKRATAEAAAGALRKRFSLGVPKLRSAEVVGPVVRVLSCAARAAIVPRYRRRPHGATASLECA